MKKRLNISILIMGFSGFVAQMLLLRELLIVFSGNELSIGVVLANWLMLEALGSFFAGRRSEKSRGRLETFVVITVIFSLSLFPAVYVTRMLKSILGIAIGQGVGLLPVLAGSFLILLPTSVTHGALFTFGCGVRSDRDGQGAAAVGKVYIYETIGTIIGGIIWTYLFIPYLDAFHIASVLAALNFLICGILLAPYWRSGRLQTALTAVSGLLFVFSGFFLLSGGAGRLHQSSVKAQWKAQNVVHYQNSIYGNICVTESGGQYTFFSDGLPYLITPVPDIAFIEEFVHLALLSHPRPETVMVLGGGAGGMIHEILKHPSVAKVEYAELDPLLLDLIREFPTDLTEDELNDSRVRVRHMDGRLLLKKTDRAYDVIFVGFPGPSDLQTNRFFTKEFFALARKRLGRDGILVFSLPGSLTYLNEELRDVNACIFNTVKSVFSYVRAMPGDGANLFLASESAHISAMDTMRVIERLTERGLQAEVLVPRNIDHKLHQGGADWFSGFLEGGTRKINRDFRPLGMFYSAIHWNAVFAPYLVGMFRWLENWALWMFGALLLIALIVIALIRRKGGISAASGIPWCVASTGFAGMMLDLALIFTFQAIYGYVFSWIGLLVAFFMAGAAGGALVVTSALPGIKDDRGVFIKIDLAIIGFSFMLPFIFLMLPVYVERLAAHLFLKAVFLVLSVVSGFLIGAQFPLANKIYLKGRDDPGRTAGLLYSADLLGGWIGGIAGSIVLLPVLGLYGSCVVIVLIKLVSLAAAASRSPKGS